MKSQKVKECKKKHLRKSKEKENISRILFSESTKTTTIVQQKKHLQKVF